MFSKEKSVNLLFFFKSENVFLKVIQPFKTWPWIGLLSVESDYQTDLEYGSGPSYLKM